MTSAATAASRASYEHPLGPKGKNGFEHDGGESIFSLPNGFQAYYLNTADGKTLDKGPTNIVRDMSRQGSRGHQRPLLHGLP